MVEGMSVLMNVMLSLISVISPPIYFGCVCFRDEFGFLNCDDICMCVLNKQFELLEIAFIPFMLTCSIISLTFTAGSVTVCCVCSHMVIFGLSVRLSWYHMWMRRLL